MTKEEGKNFILESQKFLGAAKENGNYDNFFNENTLSLTPVILK